MKKFVLLFLLLSSAAFAAQPRSESTVTGDSVTLGDVFDGVTDNASYYLAPAPAPGGTLVLNARDLARISDAFNLGWRGAGTAQTVVRRLSGTVSALEIQAALQEKISAELQNTKVEVELSDRNVSLQNSNPADRRVHMENLSYSLSRGDFSATISLNGGSSRNVTGRLFQLAAIPVLTVPKRPGDVISKSDIDTLYVRAEDIAASTIVDASRLVGMTPRRGLSAQKPVNGADVKSPIIVKKGEFVTMSLKGSQLDITTQGRALEDGAAGDVIQVMNDSSKKRVDAVVIGPQTVSIRAAEPTVTASADM